MAINILIVSVVIIICITSSKLSNKFGIPTLLLFIILGMLFGSDGIFGIQFENYDFAEQICSASLIFIIFYGGFGTNWRVAKPVAFKAILMSSVGVIITALITGLFCFLILKMNFLESLLVGAVISSTDAASVFSILRSKNLNLKYGLASLLEIESGSNDPISYMLTIIILNLMSQVSSNSIIYMVFSQITFAVIFGFFIGFGGSYILKKISFDFKGLHSIFVLSIALLSYSLPSIIGGNGYLSVYITGIILGNSKIFHKVELVHFFDGITWLMQILIFFLLGLLSFPSQMPNIIFTSIMITLFLTFISRPIAVFSIFRFFKTPLKQQILISFAGLRGAASIVFAIFAITSDAYTKSDIFHIVFCVALISVSFQGTLLPLVAKKLNLVDNSDTVLKTFNDYQDDMDIALIEIFISKSHLWVNKTLSDITFPPDSLVIMIKRNDNILIPKGSTIICENDVLILSCNTYQDNSNIKLIEVPITNDNKWIGKSLSEIKLPSDTLAVMIKRKDSTIIPHGDTIIKLNDIVVLGNYMI